MRPYIVKMTATAPNASRLLIDEKNLTFRKFLFIHFILIFKIIKLIFATYQQSFSYFQIIQRKIVLYSQLKLCNYLQISSASNNSTQACYFRSWDCNCVVITLKSKHLEFQHHLIPLPIELWISNTSYFLT